VFTGTKCCKQGGRPSHTTAMLWVFGLLYSNVSKTVHPTIRRALNVPFLPTTFVRNIFACYKFFASYARDKHRKKHTVCKVKYPLLLNAVHYNQILYNGLCTLKLYTNLHCYAFRHPLVPSSVSSFTVDTSTHLTLILYKQDYFKYHIFIDTIDSHMLYHIKTPVKWHWQKWHHGRLYVIQHLTIYLCI
jgi:hypothetical protein